MGQFKFSSGPSLLLVTCLFFVATSVADALFEDQAGLWDWHQKYIGKVQHAVFQTATQKKRVVVATEQNAIATLNLRDGEIGWRRVLAASDPVDKLLAQGKYVVSLSGRGAHLRCWSIVDGALIWEVDTSGPTPGDSAEGGASVDLVWLPVDGDGDGLHDLAVLSANTVHSISIASGAVIWKTDLEDLRSSGVTLSRLFVPPSKASLYSVGLLKNTLTLVSLSFKDGASWHTEVSGIDTLQPGSLFILPVKTRTGTTAEGVVVGALYPGRTWLAGVLVPKQLPERPLKLMILAEFDARVESVDVASRVLAITVESERPGEFLLQLMQVPDVNGDEGEQMLAAPAATFDRPGRLPVVATGAVAVEEDEVVAVFLSPKEGAGEGGAEGAPPITFVPVFVGPEDTVSVGEEVDTEWDGRAPVVAGFLNTYTRKEGGVGYRTMVVADDHSLALLQIGQLVWLREEALASVVDVQMVDPPVGEGLDVAAVERGLVDWLKSHFVQAKAALLLATPEEAAEVAAEARAHASKNANTRDHNGFRKLLVLLTASGRVLVLHNGDGRVIWGTRPPALRPQTGGPALLPHKLLLSRIPHKRAKEEAPEVVVLAKRLGRRGGAVLVWLNTYTGEEGLTAELPYSVEQVIPLPLRDTMERQLLLLVPSSPPGSPPSRVFVFPSSDEAAALVTAHAADLFFYSATEEGGAVAGYGVGRQVGPAGGEGGVEFEAQALWRLEVGAAGEGVAALAARPADNAVYTQAKVLGNRNVLYKYINSNIILVVATAPTPSSPSAPPPAAPFATAPEDSTLTAYLVDAVTGRVLFRSTHPGATGPVHAIASDNWFVYHYFNLRAFRWEVSVLELYDESKKGDASVLDILKEALPTALGGGGGGANGSSFFSSGSISSRALPSVAVMRQSYYLSLSVKSMALTATEKGITGKLLLLGTVADEVLTLDQRFVDPRRPLNPSPLDREEGLMQYAEILPIAGPAYLTQSHKVEGLRGIVSAPARLESTTLVFCYGLDLFYSRAAPSRLYDSLPQDFSYALLVITIVGLVIGIIATWFLAQRHELAMKWK